MRLLTQILTQNSCYQAGVTIAPKGVMVHSTGANNPNVARYVPGSELIGYNTNGNHWDQSNGQWQKKFGKKLDKCVHAFIGKFADGSVGTVQTLPWNMRGWHAGHKTGNDLYIGFEICEDDLRDPVYFHEVYLEAAELTAYLCRLYDIDPLAFGGVVCHSEGHDIGLASAHADVMHWFPKHGKSMDDFRADVAALMGKEAAVDKAYEQWKAHMKRYEAERAKGPVSDWAAKGLEEAKARGITDGSRPKSYATREEVALMVNKAK